MKHKYFIIIMFASFFIIGGLLSFLLRSVENKIALKVGSKIILENDTLLIVDYSTLKETYTLINGKEISFGLVDKLKTVK